MIVDSQIRRAPVKTLHLTVYNEVTYRENAAFVAGVNHAIAILSLLDEGAADRLEALLKANLFPELQAQEAAGGQE